MLDTDIMTDLHTHTHLLAVELLKESTRLPLFRAMSSSLVTLQQSALSSSRCALNSSLRCISLLYATFP